MRCRLGVPCPPTAPTAPTYYSPLLLLLLLLARARAGNDADNRPKPGNEQHAILEARSPAVLAALEAGSDYRLKIKSSAADKGKPDEEASPKKEWSAVDAVRRCGCRHRWHECRRCRSADAV